VNRLEIGIAFRYLRSRRESKFLSLISIIAILGVTIAVCALIVTIGIMNGLQTDLREKILIGSPSIKIVAKEDDAAMSDWHTLMQTVAAQKGVVTLAPFVNTQALIQSKGHVYREAAVIEGLLPDGPHTPQVTALRAHASAGDFTFATTDGRHRGAVLGERLAEQLNVVPGVDSVTLLAGDPNKINGVTGMPTPVVTTLEVTGILSTGVFEYDNSYVVVSLSVAQELAQLGGAVTGLEVKTKSRDAAVELAPKIAAVIGPRFQVLDWREQNTSLFTALKLEKLGMAVILGLIGLVAAFNIVSTLVMVVTDKTKEIGILRAMGMPASSVRRVFFAQGLAIGAIGTTAGLLLGVGVSLAIGVGKLIRLDPRTYFIDHVPVSMQPMDVGLIVFVSLAIAAIATVYPALQAAKLYPVDAIRRD